jgi:hypothetical protein
MAEQRELSHWAKQENRARHFAQHNASSGALARSRSSAEPIGKTCRETLL